MALQWHIKDEPPQQRSEYKRPTHTHTGEERRFAFLGRTLARGE